MRWAKRIAQAAPAPDSSQPAGDPPQPAGDPPQPAEASGDQPAPADSGQPTPEQPAPAPEGAQPSTSAESAPGLSDAELQKLSEQEAKTEVITVTGTLINRKEVDSPSPVTVVDKEKLTSAGITNVGDVLQKIPAQGNAINAQNNNGGDGSTRIDLRSLGTRRTLVLLNGRRVVASGTGADDSVDLGTIPLAMIERVEVLKDGASAIYGSDAIAGVVNIITRTNLNGTEASIYTATSQERDGSNYELSFVTGHSTEKGNITFSGGFQQQKPIFAGERDFSATTSRFDYETGEAILSGSSANPRGLITIPKNKDGSRVFSIEGCDSDLCTSDGTGGFRPYRRPTATAFNDAYNFQTLNYVLTPSKRINLFSNGRYELTKHIEAFFEGQFNDRTSDQQLAEEPLVLANTNGVVISKDSYYNTTGQDITNYNRRLVEFGPRGFKQDISTSRLVVGLKGSIPDEVPVFKDWKWETSYNYGRSTATQENSGSLIISHLANALGPSFKDVDGTVKCGTAGNVKEGCIPLGLLRPGIDTVSTAAIKYLTFTGITDGFNEQHTAQATASGKLVDLPNHGDISVAIGADYRFERGANTPDPLTATGDTTGNAFEPTAGSYNTFEGFGELSVVPISGTEYLKWVELDAAARAYRYNTFGSGVTGKLSGLVRTVGGVAVRGTYGTAFRAPNIGELFSGQADNFVAVDDPCNTDGGAIVLTGQTKTQCEKQGVPTTASFTLPQQRSKVGGNPDLQPEKATIGTAGVVYEPLKNLDFTLDYWHYQIDNAVQALGTPTILSQCYQAGDPAFCELIQRDPNTHVINYVFDLRQNVGARSTSGLDFSAAYQYRTKQGTFRHALEGTWLFMDNLYTGTTNPVTGKEDVIHGKGFYDLGVNPDLKANLFTSWSHPSGLGAGFNIRFVDSFQECDNDDCNTGTNLRRDVPKYGAGDLFFNYAMKTSRGTTSITAGVNNVTNAKPPVIYNGAALNADESAYDFIGRMVYLRLAQQF